jgi:hypothetical protein
MEVRGLAVVREDLAVASVAEVKAAIEAAVAQVGESQAAIQAASEKLAEAAQTMAGALDGSGHELVTAVERAQTYAAAL